MRLRHKFPIIHFTTQLSQRQIGRCIQKSHARIGIITGSKDTRSTLNSEYARVSANFRTTEAGANVGMAIPGWATFATFAVTGPLRLIASGILAGSTSEGGFSGCGALASLGGGALRKGAAVANSIEKKSAFEAEPSGAGGGGPSGNGPPSAPLEPSYGPYRHGLNKGGLNDIVTNQRLLSTEASSIAGGKLA